MKSFVIAIENNKTSQQAADACIESSKNVNNPFIIEKFNAIIPKQVDGLMSKYNLKWNYPWVGEEFDFSTGLKKSAYKTANPKNRIACALSHYMFWRQCAGAAKPFLILEHDAIFTDQLDETVLTTNHQIIGINNPLYATRKAREFAEIAKRANGHIVPVPTVDSVNVPQGLAGNSAYIIKPDGAKQMLKLVKQYGLWPNDALMCKQLVKGMGVTRKFYTRVQGLPSTTT